AFGMDDRTGIDDLRDARDAHGAVSADFDLDNRGDVGRKAARDGQAHAAPIALRAAAPAGAFGGHLQHAAQPADVVRVRLGTYAVVPEVGQAGGLQVEQARRPEQVELELERITAGRGGELVDEALRGEYVIDVRHRSEPANPHVRGCRTVLG